MHYLLFQLPIQLFQNYYPNLTYRYYSPRNGFPTIRGKTKATT